MMPEKKKIECRCSLTSADVAAYLEAFVKGFREGRITVERGCDSLELVPAGQVDVEVEARVKGDRQRFSLEVSWETETPALREPLTINAVTPACCAPTPAASGTHGGDKPVCPPKDHKPAGK